MPSSGAECRQKDWSHVSRRLDRVEAKFVVNDSGLRNRRDHTETAPLQPRFYRARLRRITLTSMALLRIHQRPLSECATVLKRVPTTNVARVGRGRRSGTLKNFLDGEYRSLGPVDILSAYRNQRRGVILPAPASRNATGHGKRNQENGGRSKSDHGLSDTAKASVPARICARVIEHATSPAKLRAHNVNVRALDGRRGFDGESFAIGRCAKARRSG